jgi:hypothetical protein
MNVVTGCDMYKGGQGITNGVKGNHNRGITVSKVEILRG